MPEALNKLQIAYDENALPLQESTTLVQVLAQLYSTQNQIDKAKILLLDFIKKAEKTPKGVPGIANIYGLTALVYATEKDYETAYMYITKAIDISGGFREDWYQLKFAIEYQKKDYINECIESVISQTYKNLEIIIIYDNETNSELDYIKNLKKKDFRIRLIINENNIGAGESRNKGIKHSKGKYISFLDADDIWEKNKIEIQLLFMQNGNLSVSHTSYKIINEENNLVGNRKARDFDNFKDIIKSCDIGLSSVMLKKEIISDDIKFSNLKTKEDFILWLKILIRLSLNSLTFDIELS